MDFSVGHGELRDVDQHARSFKRKHNQEATKYTSTIGSISAWQAVKAPGD